MRHSGPRGSVGRWRVVEGAHSTATTRRPGNEETLVISAMRHPPEHITGAAGSMPDPSTSMDGAALRRRFAATGGFTVGLEEETMLLHPDSLDLAPIAADVLARLHGDLRFKPELPAAQLEIMTSPEPTAGAAIAQLAAARRDLVAAAAGLARPVAAGVHPFAAPKGPISQGSRYEKLRRAYGDVVHRQLVASLQIHVAVGGAERSLAVYNGLRCLLPEIMALSANAPFHQGLDSGLATVRPGICLQLPRQGVPPPLQSWDQLAAELQWGRTAGMVPEASSWWWELRPHPVHGTLELRVPDAQTTVGQAAGLVAFAHALVATLSARWDAGERLPAAPRWRIEENRWSAARSGVEGTLADLRTGEREATRVRLSRLVDEVTPAAERLGAAELLVHTRALIERNGAIEQREVAAGSDLHGPHDLHGLARWLAERFLDGICPGGAPLAQPSARRSDVLPSRQQPSR